MYVCQYVCHFQEGHKFAGLSWKHDNRGRIYAFEKSLCDIHVPKKWEQSDCKIYCFEGFIVLLTLGILLDKVEGVPTFVWLIWNAYSTRMGVKFVYLLD